MFEESDEIRYIKNEYQDSEPVEITQEEWDHWYAEMNEMEQVPPTDAELDLMAIRFNVDAPF